MKKEREEISIPGVWFYIGGMGTVIFGWVMGFWAGVSR